MKIEDLDINIADHGENVRDIDEIISNLGEFLNNFDTRAMSDRTLFLQGQKDMLEKIIIYLGRIIE